MISRFTKSDRILFSIADSQKFAIKYSLCFMRDKEKLADLKNPEKYHLLLDVIYLGEPSLSLGDLRLTP